METIISIEEYNKKNEMCPLIIPEAMVVSHYELKNISDREFIAFKDGNKAIYLMGFPCMMSKNLKTQ
jgi:hypothetical protein